MMMMMMMWMRLLAEARVPGGWMYFSGSDSHLCCSSARPFLLKVNYRNIDLNIFVTSLLIDWLTDAHNQICCISTAVSQTSCVGVRVRRDAWLRTDDCLFVCVCVCVCVCVQVQIVLLDVMDSTGSVSLENAGECWKRH